MNVLREIHRKGIKDGEGEREMKDGGESSCRFASFKESNDTFNAHVEHLDDNYSMCD